MMIQGFKIRRVMRGEDASAWVRSLEAGAWLGSAQVLKDQPGSGWVRRGTINGVDVVVKCRVLSSMSRRLKAMVGHGQGDRQWRACARLAMKRIPCSKPVMLGHGEVDGVTCELIVLRWAPGRTVLELLAAIASGGADAPGAAEQHRIASAVGATVPALLRAGMWNRDHKPSNLVVDRDEQGKARVTLIDVVGIGRYGWMGIDESEAEQMCASLVIEPTGCGCPPRRALWMRGLLGMMEEKDRRAPRAERHADLRAMIGEVGGLVEAHGDARPRVDLLKR